jgi:hypothetical protein
VDIYNIRIDLTRSELAHDGARQDSDASMLKGGEIGYTPSPDDNDDDNELLPGEHPLSFEGYTSDNSSKLN